MEEQNFFVYSDENEVTKCLYRYYTRILLYLNKQARVVFYEFIMGNKHEVLG